ncbi:MAG: tetratricopeptide repeat protein [Acidobacteriota bacterium]|nr:tetratricopeptide repeat protein [Acidobacteriota bacterium]
MRAISVLLLSMLYALAQDPLSTGIAEYNQGRLSAARKHLEKSKSTEARAFLALVLAASGECASQLPTLQEIWRGAASPQLRRLAGMAAVQCDIARGKPEAGIPLVNELKSAYPQDADVLYLAAKLYMKGWNEQVAAMYAKTPSSYRVNQLSAEIFETQGNYSEAAAEYAKAIQKNPSAINLHYRRGRALLLSSHEPPILDRARREFEAELALNAEDAAAEYQIGQILEVEGNRDGATRRFERAAALRPNFPEALVAVAKARIRERRNDEAVTLLQHAIDWQPDNETAHYNLMLAYRNAGNAAAAAREKAELDRLQRPPAGEFADFLKKLGEKPPPP